MQSNMGYAGGKITSRQAFYLYPRLNIQHATYFNVCFQYFIYFIEHKHTHTNIDLRSIALILRFG